MTRPTPSGARLGALLPLAALLLAALLLAGCGTKPASLEPPDPEGRSFPRQYPAS